MKEEPKTGWYIHTNNDHSKWKVFLDVENKTYHGVGVDGSKMTNTDDDYSEMCWYIKNNCIISE